MSDLTVDAGDLAGANASIAAITQAVLSIGNQAEQAMLDAANTVSHPGLRSAIDEAYFQARATYQTVTTGLSALGRFAATTATTFEQSDHALADTMKEVTS